MFTDDRTLNIPRVFQPNLWTDIARIETGFFLTCNRTSNIVITVTAIHAPTLFMDFSRTLDQCDGRLTRLPDDPQAPVLSGA